mgnify:CR=1 FL=1
MPPDTRYNLLETEQALDRALGAIEIVPKSGSGFYDYKSKYTAGQTEYVIPVPMDRDILLRAAEYTRRADHERGHPHIPPR